jgi:hypothetical protein
MGVLRKDILIKRILNKLARLSARSQILTGWLVGLGWLVFLNTFFAMYERFGLVMGVLLVPVWLLALCLAIAGSFRICSQVISNKGQAILVTVAAVFLQLVIFFFVSLKVWWLTYILFSTLLAEPF